MLKEAEVAARALGVRLQFVEARGPAYFDRAFSDMTKARAGALTVLTSNMFFIERRRLVDLAAKHRLPAVYQWREGVDAGGLMAYGPNVTDLFRRAAPYVENNREPDPSHGGTSIGMAGGSLAEGLKLSLRPTPTGYRVHGSGTLLSPLFLEGSDVPAARKERRLFLCVTDAEAFYHAIEGHCVAVLMLDSSRFVGEPMVGPM